MKLKKFLNLNNYLLFRIYYIYLYLQCEVEVEIVKIYGCVYFLE